MMVPAVVISCVMLLLLSCVLMAYPVAPFPLYLQPPSDCANMLCGGGVGGRDGDWFVDVGVVIHYYVAYLVRCFVILSVSPVDVRCCCGCCVPSCVRPCVCTVYDAFDCRF